MHGRFTFGQVEPLQSGSGDTIAALLAIAKLADYRRRQVALAVVARLRAVDVAWQGVA